PSWTTASASSPRPCPRCVRRPSGSGSEQGPATSRRSLLARRTSSNTCCSRGPTATRPSTSPRCSTPSAASPTPSPARSTPASTDSVRAFHRAGYHPRNIVVSAAGSIEHDRLSGWIASLFPGDERLALRREPVAAAAGRRLHVVEKESEQVHLLLGGLGYSL